MVCLLFRLFCFGVFDLFYFGWAVCMAVIVVWMFGFGWFDLCIVDYVTGCFAGLLLVCWLLMLFLGVVCCLLLGNLMVAEFG